MTMEQSGTAALVLCLEFCLSLGCLQCDFWVPRPQSQPPWPLVSGTQVPLLWVPNSDPISYLGTANLGSGSWSLWEEGRFT